MNIRNYLTHMFFSNVTLFGSPIFYGVVVLGLATVNFSIALRLFIIMFFLEITSAIIKFTYDKQRPGQLTKRKDLWGKYVTRSFPSVHTARITTLSVIGMEFYLYLGIIGLGLSIAVGFSRIYLRKHDWLDVVGGIVIGVVFGLVGIGFKMFY